MLSAPKVLGEAPLAEIKNHEQLEAWLRKQPREVAVAFAARAALRVLPVLQLARDKRFKGDFLADIMPPVFRATSVAWVAAKYRTQATRLAAATAAFASARSAAAAAAATAAFAAASATSAARSAASAAAAAATAAATAAFARSAASAAADFWSAVSLDATRLEGSTAASDIASSPLWPNGQPAELRSLWQEMKEALQAAKQDWEVWTDWYENRLAGRVREERRELAYVRVDNDLWNQGPAIVNAEIKRLIEEHESPPFGGWDVSFGLTGAHAIARAAGEHEPPPRRKEEPEPSPAEVKPPEAPLLPPSPATRFIVRQGIVDVVPPTAWAGREAQVATYHVRARTIALRFADKFANTNAEPELAASVHALVEVLGDDPTQAHPDQLRLASRTIAAKARAYGHPSARGELSVESVSTLFELADVLVSLQALATPELEEHERAIRALDLTEDSVSEAKEGLDLVAEAIAAVSEMVSEHASVAFEASAAASDNVADKTVQITIEGDRLLLTENLVLALAHALAEPEAKVEVGEAEVPLATEIVQRERPAQRKKPKAQRPSKTTRGRASRQIPNEQSWEDLKDRFIARLQSKGPDRIADATLDAVTSTIKHLPKTIPVLAGLVYAAVGWAPTLVAAGGGLSISLAWIGYELWKREKPPG